MVHFQEHLFQKFKTLFIQLQNTLSYIQYSCYDWISQKIYFQENLLHGKKIKHLPYTLYAYSYRLATT